MADWKGFRRDHKGIGQILKSKAVADAINDLAEAAAAAARTEIDDPTVEVLVDRYETDRGAAAVVIADARGQELQMTRGTLTRAAARVGLEVKAKK